MIRMIHPQDENSVIAQVHQVLADLSLPDISVSGEGDKEPLSLHTSPERRTVAICPAVTGSP
jgi:hypothetical protein